MTGERDPSKEEMAKAIENAIAKTRASKYDDAITTFEAYLPKLSSGTDDDKRLAATAFSYYGVCVAELRKQYLDAKQYCELSLKVHPKDPDHYENLGRVHVLARARKGAVDALFKGLEYNPDHKGIHKVLDDMGRRQDPVIPFLSRDNPLNIYLGKRRHEKFEERRAAAIARRKKQIAAQKKQAAAAVKPGSAAKK